MAGSGNNESLRRFPFSDAKMKPAKIVKHETRTTQHVARSIKMQQDQQRASELNNDRFDLSPNTNGRVPTDRAYTLNPL